jgi:hydroxymethylpyrimidine/phosphomethylpyrimidine kinase
MGPSLPRPSLPLPSHRAPSHPPLIALTIAGHDPSSGAGITADLQTFAAHRLFGTSAITALTVQSTLGVAGVAGVDPAVLAHVLAHLCADLPPAGIKIGMLGSAEIAATVADFLGSFRPPCISNCRPELNAGAAFQVSAWPVVLDPVLRSSSGAALLTPEALAVLSNRLLPAIDWITPNWTELAALAAPPTGQSIATLAEAEAAMHRLGHRHPHLHIVATGGDHDAPTDLLRLPSGELHQFRGEHVSTTSTHGTGCAFSSALLSRLILGDDPIAAVASAKSYVAGALRHAPGLGDGSGPLDLLWRLHRA